MAFTISANAEVLQEIVVKDGDTLWSVANYYLKDPKLWPEILRFNHLPSSDPNVILPGMKLKIPTLLIKENLRAARLIYLLNEVLYRKKSDAEWKNSSENMELYNEDGLRTLQASKAKVKFSSGEIISIDENSLIILRPEQKREEIDLLSGGVRASKTRILAAGSMIDPRIEPRGAAPDYRTKVKEDKTTLVEVYEGIVDVQAQGKTVTLTKGFGTEVKFLQPPSLPRQLPPSPDMNNQIPGTNLTATGKIAQGSLELHVNVPQLGGDKKEPGTRVLGQIVSKYHLQISTSSSFGLVIFDTVDKIADKVNIDFKKYKLSDGIYYYRFAYMDEMGFEGQFSSPVQFIIDTTPPAIEIESPQNEEEFDTEFIHIRGKTEPDVQLTINNKAATLESDGKFSSAIMPRMGPNLISFLAKDSAGNITKIEIIANKVKSAVKKPMAVYTEKKGLTFVTAALGTLTISVILGVLILIIK